MKKLQFKTNSRHISQLGRELVTDFVTALVELIKNSYDADAYGVKIILDKPNTPQSRIVLIDTGTGMTQSDLKELYKEDDFVKQIGKLSSNDEEVSAQKIDEAF